MKRIIAFLMSVMLVGSCCFMISNAEKDGEVNEQDNQPVSLEIKEDDGTYAAYLAAYSASPMATEDLKVMP